MNEGGGFKNSFSRKLPIFQMSEEDVAGEIGDISIPCEILEEIFLRLQTKFLLTQVQNYHKN